MDCPWICFCIFFFFFFFLGGRVGIPGTFRATPKAVINCGTGGGAPHTKHVYSEIVFKQMRISLKGFENGGGPWGPYIGDITNRKSMNIEDV